MAKKLNVTNKSITVHNNGESIGKGNLYYSFDIDGSTLVELSSKDARKTSDGEVVPLNAPRIDNKVGNDMLEISGAIQERSWPSRDEKVSFIHQYTAANGWGVGPHDVRGTDGRLDVTVRYEIANA